MIRRLRLVWPDPRPFVGRDRRPIRWLVVSDDLDPALEYEVNRTALGTIDSIVGCGDLEPEYLGFLGDAFHAPVEFVRGNHDQGGRWAETSAHLAPQPLSSGRWHEINGLSVLALEWPGVRYGDRLRHDQTAWLDAVRAWRTALVRHIGGRDGAALIVSHAPPRGVGDRAADPYHVGFRGYLWLLDRIRPPLWLHGHVPPASVEAWRVQHGPTTVVNATGAVLVELEPAVGDRSDRNGDGHDGADRGGQEGANDPAGG
jgi:uncharacterized protein